MGSPEDVKSGSANRGKKMGNKKADRRHQKSCMTTIETLLEANVCKSNVYPSFVVFEKLIKDTFCQWRKKISSTQLACGNHLLSFSRSDAMSLQQMRSLRVIFETILSLQYSFHCFAHGYTRLSNIRFKQLSWICWELATKNIFALAHR